MSRRQYTIELPASVGRRVDRAAKREKRNPSDLAVEALRLYFNFPTEIPTEAELQALSDAYGVDVPKLFGARYPRLQDYA